MEKELLSDIINWDIRNWSRALRFWGPEINGRSNLDCLELGAREGGLTLWLALKGNQVICSDLDDPGEFARPIHSKYNCSENIRYESINALEIPYNEHFDIIVFKSILGGISRDGQDHIKKVIIDQIHESLKPGGILLFAENLKGSGFHLFFRKRFTGWGGSWNYLRYPELAQIFSSFNSVEYKTAGFLGLFGRAEWQRSVLGIIDRFLELVIPPRSRYIVYGIARK